MGLTQMSARAAIIAPKGCRLPIRLFRAKNEPSTNEGFSTMIQLYWSPRSRSFTCLWLMEETGLPYERVLTDISTGAQKAPEFLKINPMGKVPGLKDDKVALGETSAICVYIADRYPETKLAPALNDPKRGRYLQWLFFLPSCVEPALIQIFTKLEVPASTAAWGSATQVFDVLDAELQRGPWILGEDFSAADVAIGSGLNYAVRLFKMVPSRTSFEDYIARCAARPAFKRAEGIAAG
jgi:glutathione S-transferase